MKPASDAHHHSTETFNPYWRKAGGSIQVSVVMPSYNRYPLNLLSLYSLENQDFDATKFEVILINDASTDDTRKILSAKELNLPLHYIHLERNFGRAKTRNLGIAKARGEIVVFLDAEMIVGPHFLTNHYKEHLNQDRLVVTGSCHLKNVFSCIFPEFSANQRAILKKLVSRDFELFARYINYVHKKRNHSEKPWPLLKRSDMVNQKYQKLLAPYPNFFAQMRRYGKALTGFGFPWMAFLTGNVSVRKRLLTEVGGFDEDFVLYGYEDWELGYRLYKAGAQFRALGSVKSYHQQHPVLEDTWNQAVTNYLLFVEKHPETEVKILALELLRLLDLHSMNAVLLAYKDLSKQYPNRFTSLREGLEKIFNTAPKLLPAGLGKDETMLDALEISQRKIRAIRKDISLLTNLERYRCLTDFLDKLLFQTSK